MDKKRRDEWREWMTDPESMKGAPLTHKEKLALLDYVDALEVRIVKLNEYLRRYQCREAGIEEEG